MNSIQSLDGRLFSIGINIATTEERYAYTDIEKTLCLAASQIPNDKRLLSLLLSWIKIHGGKVNLERLRKISKADKPAWLSLLAYFGVHSGHNRWKILAKNAGQDLANGSLENARLRVEFKGEEPWAKGTGFLIPKGSEPVDEKYVLNPFQLSALNKHYRNKLIYGANWRADIVTAIEAGAKNSYQAAKISSASYEPAHRVFEDMVTAGIMTA